MTATSSNQSSADANPRAEYFDSKYKVEPRRGDARFVQDIAAVGVAAGISPLEAALGTDLREFADLLDPERIVGNLHRAVAEALGEPWGVHWTLSQPSRTWSPTTAAGRCRVVPDVRSHGPRTQPARRFSFRICLSNARAGTSRRSTLTRPASGPAV